MKTRSLTLSVMLLGLAAGSAETSENLSAPAEVTTTAPEEIAEAQFQKARDLLLGKGGAKDEAKSFELMQQAAAGGNADAMGGVGYFHSRGIVVEKDEKRAMEWFAKGAEKGSSKSQLNLGKMLLDAEANATDGSGKPGSSRDTAIGWIRKSADQGLKEAAVLYGSMLYYGDNGVTKAPDKAVVYFKVAAEQQDPDALNFLGVMCELGEEMPKDLAGATGYFRKAALQGLAKAQGNLGRVLDPLADDNDTRMEALAWLLIASSAGDASARRTLDDATPSLKQGEIEQARMRMAEIRKSIVRERR